MELSSIWYLKWMSITIYNIIINFDGKNPRRDIKLVNNRFFSCSWFLSTSTWYWENKPDSEETNLECFLSDWITKYIEDDIRPEFWILSVLLCSEWYCLSCFAAQVSTPLIRLRGRADVIPSEDGSQHHTPSSPPALRDISVESSGLGAGYWEIYKGVESVQLRS